MKIKQVIRKIILEIEILEGDNTFSINIDKEYTLYENDSHVPYPLNYKASIEWDFGNKEYIDLHNLNEDTTISHTFEPGIHHIYIDGVWECLNLIGSTQLRKILSWGKPETTNLKVVKLEDSNLTDVASETGGLSNVLNFNASFKNTKLKRVPDKMFGYNTIATEFYYVFQECSELEYIPRDLFKGNNMKWLVDTFQGCSSLKEIPIGLLETNTNLTYSSNLFNGCSSLTSIPDDLFSNCPNLGDTRSLFKDCVNITEIPANLFENQNNIYMCVSMFENMGISEVPDGLLDNIRYYDNGSGYIRIFANCKKLTTIPSDLLKNNSRLTNQTTLSYMFSGCSSLTEIPSDFFEGLTMNIRGFFSHTGIKNLPADFFKDSDISFGMQMFEGCVIETIDDNFLRNCGSFDVQSMFEGTTLPYVPQIFDNYTDNSVSAVFKNATFIDPIVPENLFPTTVTYFSSAFEGTNITTFPESLFSTNGNAYTYTFANCKSLVSIPQIRSVSNISGFVGMFSGCTSLTTVPDYNQGYKLIPDVDPNGSYIYKHFKHMFDGCDLHGEIQPIWDDFHLAYGDYCFNNNTNLDNYSDIPQSWITVDNGGGGSGSSSSSSSSGSGSGS